MQRMVREQIAQHVDKKVLDWLTPGFSTTTDVDQVVASISIMATMKQFFNYSISMKCGIPKVTLMGTAADWCQLRMKIDGLLTYKLRRERFMQRWHSMLAPILDNFVASKKDPAQRLEFWDQAGVGRAEGQVAPRHDRATA